MAAGVFMAPVGQAVAGFYENKVITIVIPFGPGGGPKGANYFYSVAPSQGTHIALLSQTAPLFQHLEKLEGPPW